MCVVGECGNVALAGVRSLHAFLKNESVCLAFRSRNIESYWSFMASVTFLKY